MSPARPFAKMHGLGNDFVVVRAGGWSGADAQAVCSRRFGVGADGLILLQLLGSDRVAMAMFNPDGSESGMCGNGLRCASLFAQAEGWCGSQVVVVMAGVDFPVEVHSPSRIATLMGPPDFSPAGAGVAWPGPWIDQEIEPGLRGTAVGMGNPHFVLFGDADSLNSISRIGPRLEHHPIFPQRSNIHTAWVESRSRVRMATWERGAGLTLACGSGACAVFASARRLGLIDSPATISLPGGDALLEEAEGRLRLTGPAAFVYRGEWPGSATPS
jgi:diaminopimelate epimerase